MTSSPRPTRPALIGVCVDKHLTHDRNGALLPFWSSLLRGFITTAEQRDHLVLVSYGDLQDREIPTDALVLLTAGQVTATMSRPERRRGGVVGGRDGLPGQVAQLCFVHPHTQIGEDVARMLIGRGCRHVLVVEHRAPSPAAESIASTCEDLLCRAGVKVSTVNEGSGAPGVHLGATDPIDGLFSLEPELPSRSAILATMPELASRLAVRLVTIAEPQTACAPSRPGDALLSLEGARCGELIAHSVVTARMGPTPSATAVELPYRLRPVGGQDR